MIRICVWLTMLLLVGCGTGIGWPKPPPEAAAAASDWTKPGADAATVASAYDECLEAANTATRTDFGIDQDIASSRSGDLQRSEFAQGQMQQSRDTSRERAQTVLSSCMAANGFSPARK
jgi:hypothetical protein